MATKPKQSMVPVDRAAGTKSLMFGMVRIDVKYKPLFDDLKAERPERHQICGEHKTQLKMAHYCEEGEHFLKHNEVKKAVLYEDHWIEVTDEELKELENPSDGVVELVAMSDWLDPSYVEKTYALWPADPTWAKPFALLQELLSVQDGMLMGMTIESGTSRAYAIRVMELREGFDLMVAHLCHHSLALRLKMGLDISGALKEKLEAPSKEELKMAHTVFDALPQDFPNAYIDELGLAQWKLVKTKAAGKKMVRSSVRTVDAETDLMAALRASAAEVQGKKKKTPAPAAKKTTKEKGPVR